MYSTKTIHKNINPNYQQTYTSIGDPYKGTTEAVPSRWKSKQLSTTSFPQNASNGFFQKLSYDPGKSTTRALGLGLSLLESSSNSLFYYSLYIQSLTLRVRKSTQRLKLNESSALGLMMLSRVENLLVIKLQNGSVRW